MYLPFAKRLLTEGFSFFSSEESLGVAPGTYVWPALFGAIGTTVKVANLVCGIFMVVLVYLIGERLHSKKAGALSALLFSLSPLTIYLIPTAQSEPQFFLFTLLWLWATCEVCNGKTKAIPVAAIALSFSILIRSVWWYPAIILLIVLLILAFFVRKNEEVFKPISHLAILFFCALLLPAFVIIRNYILFGYPSFSTGAGLQVFYGANLLTGGFEPPLLGLSYSTPTLSDNTIIQERKIMLMGIEFLKTRNFMETFYWFVKKMSWVISFTTLEANLKLAMIRSSELGLGLISTIWAIRHKKYIILLFSLAILCQILQTSAVLYNIRYSIGNVELLLIPLAGVGIAIFLDATKVKHKTIIFTLGLITFLISLTMYFKVSPMIEYGSHIPKKILFQTNRHNTQINPTELSYDIPLIDIKDFDQILWKIDFSKKNNCMHFYSRFETTDSITAKNIYLQKFNAIEDGLIIGTAIENKPLLPVKVGTFVIGYECPDGVVPQVSRLSIVGSTLFSSTWEKMNSVLKKP